MSTSFERLLCMTFLTLFCCSMCRPSMITMKLVGACEQARRVLILESVLSAVLFSCFFFSMFFFVFVKISEWERSVKGQRMELSIFFCLSFYCTGSSAYLYTQGSHIPSLRDLSFLHSHAARAHAACGGQSFIHICP